MTFEFSNYNFEKGFLGLLTKKRLRYCYAGAHTGAPLRLYLKGFHAFVGADLCVRPQER